VRADRKTYSETRFGRVLRISRALADSPVYRAALYVFLAGNTFYFALAGTPSKALDAAAWLILLALFEIEGRFPHWISGGRRRATIHVLRVIAAAGVLVATVAYALEEDVLDAINAVLWIAVVILLEAEIRLPRWVARARAAFIGIAVLLYGALAVLVVLWGAAGLWFDAYDAALWLIAFATLELDVGGARLRLGPGHPTEQKETHGFPP
jgi:hypothetical protein